MARNPLTRSEREEIRAGIAASETNEAIAARLGRSASCVGNEINRNGGRWCYRADAAQDRADEQRARPKLTVFQLDPVLARYVERRLRAKDSPMTISIELKRGVHGHQAQVSHETIYQAVQQAGRGLEPGLHKGLHLKRRRRRHRNTPVPQAVKAHPLGQFASIHDRPAIADERVELGHLEGDLIVGAYNRSAMITLFDRCARMVWLCRLSTGKGADGVYRALGRTLARIPPEFLNTLTWDQGSEMADHLKLAERCGIDIYFADPKSPWQRPTNENGNALVRRYVGKSTDLTQFTTKQLRRIEHRINTMPRRSLNWNTANDIYHQHLALTG